MSFPALAHVAVTVRDLTVSTPWYRALFDSDPVLDEDTDAGFHHVVWQLGDGTLFGIHRHTTAAPDEAFSEFRAGLDHVQLGQPRLGHLDALRRLDQLRHGPRGRALGYGDGAPAAA